MRADQAAAIVAGRFKAFWYFNKDECDDFDEIDAYAEKLANGQGDAEQADLDARPEQLGEHMAFAGRYRKGEGNCVQVYIEREPAPSHAPQTPTQMPEFIYHVMRKWTYAHGDSRYKF